MATEKDFVKALKDIKNNLQQLQQLILHALFYDDGDNTGKKELSLKTRSNMNLDRSYVG